MDETSMEKPVIFAKKPIKVQLSKGEKYYWCSCGRSEKQPFCDGSHKDVTEFTPKSFSPEQSGSAYLCQCKHTKTPPYCDGSHAKL